MRSNSSPLSGRRRGNRMPAAVGSVSLAPHLGEGFANSSEERCGLVVGLDLIGSAPNVALLVVGAVRSQREARRDSWCLPSTFKKATEVLGRTRIERRRWSERRPRRSVRLGLRTLRSRHGDEEESCASPHSPTRAREKREGSKETCAV